jgi:hypothetical protein
MRSGEIGLKNIAFFIILVHTIIFILWIMNSGYLFSSVGTTFWITSVALGFLIQKQLDDVMMLRKILVISNWWMVFLMIMTVGIYFVVSSMP